ncbi:conserved hypothetical protein [Herminiimonas arsenicoxydans]|uniref:DUF1854 domain-containing protein n=1 Tax=Herminiimonas arsenicoxydans TaxID=204773 RepID=A4GA88_HERAR|nr:conserved hypothetical protein [Herminiimonas arsenicoxydans]
MSDVQSIPFQLSRNAFGKLVYSAPGETEVHEGVVPVRAFPIAAPDTGIAIVSTDGRELAWIDRLSDLPETIRGLLEEELASREFLPEITRIKHVSAFASPSTWTVATSRGDALLVLKGEEDIRRIGESSLIIADTHGIQFLIRDLQKLDKHSRKLLDRFL